MKATGRVGLASLLAFASSVAIAAEAKPEKKTTAPEGAVVINAEVSQKKHISVAVGDAVDGGPDAKLEPVYEEMGDSHRHIHSFRVLSIRPGSPLSNLSLVEGDVIHNINGKDLYSVGDLENAYLSLRAGNRAVVDLTRDGREQTFVCTIPGA